VLLEAVAALMGCAAGRLPTLESWPELLVPKLTATAALAAAKVNTMAAVPAASCLMVRGVLLMDITLESRPLGEAL
jgi:hypothetical protein